MVLVVWEGSGLPVVRSVNDNEVECLPKDQTCCVWSAGFIANAARLARSHGLPPSASHSQLLLDLYEQHGSQVASLINGTFAWILWDGRQKVLHAVRDRMGTHGLYYVRCGARTLLATRIELLLNALPNCRDLNPRSVTACINGQVPLAGETFYSDIAAVKAGNQLAITHAQARSNSYWTVEPQPLLNLPSDQAYAAAFRDLLFEVIDDYVAPKRRIGVTVSGGLDSTSVAAAIRARAPGVECTAFSWVTPELPSADESAYASSVHDYLNLPAVAIRADQHWPLSNNEGIDTPPSGPYYGYYMELWKATFEVMQQHGVELILSGTGGDHLFGADVFAYPDLLVSGRWLELVRQLRVHLESSEKNVAQILWLGAVRPILDEFLPRRRHAEPVEWLAPSYRQLYREHFAGTENLPIMLPGRRKRLRILQHPSLSHIIEEQNMLASRYGLEYRRPLIDHRLVEFSASLPTTQSFHANVRKYIVRNAMRGFLPGMVLDFQGKIYPTAIVDRGLGERERDKVWRLMTDMRAAELGFVDQDRLRGHYEGYLDGKHRNRWFWWTLTLEDWLRRYF